MVTGGPEPIFGLHLSWGVEGKLRLECQNHRRPVHLWVYSPANSTVYSGCPGEGPPDDVDLAVFEEMFPVDEGNRRDLWQSFREGTLQRMHRKCKVTLDSLLQRCLAMAF